MIFDLNLYSRDVFGLLTKIYLEDDIEATKHNIWKTRKFRWYYRRLLVKYLELSVDIDRADIDEWILNWGGIKAVPQAIDYGLRIIKKPNLYCCIDHARYYPHLMNFFLKFRWVRLCLKNFITEDPNYDQRLMNYLRKLEL